jgi:hypothetical protein
MLIYILAYLHYIFFLNSCMAFHSFILSPMALEPFIEPWPLLQFRNLFYTGCRTPWTGNQSVARPLPTHRTTQTQNKRTQTSMPRVGFEPTAPALENEDSSCLRPRGHCDRPSMALQNLILKWGEAGGDFVRLFAGDFAWNLGVCICWWRRFFSRLRWWQQRDWALTSSVKPCWRNRIRGCRLATIGPSDRLLWWL